MIADFEAYPEWSTAIKSGHRRRGRRLTAAARKATFTLDAGVLKDTYTLGLHLVRRRPGRLALWSTATTLKSQEGTYDAESGRQQHGGDLPPRRRPEGPDARHVQAQGRENDHRHRAEGPEEARRSRVARSPPVPVTCRGASPAVHRQGRRREDDHIRGDGCARGGARQQDPGARPPTRRTRSPTRSASTLGARADRDRHRALRPAGRHPARLRGELARGAALPARHPRAGRRRPARGRGAHRAPGRRGGPRAARAPRTRSPAAAGTPSSSTARRPARRCGCSRCPRRCAGGCAGSSRRSAA